MGFHLLWIFRITFQNFSRNSLFQFNKIFVLVIRKSGVVIENVSNQHCVKHQNFTYFAGMEILKKPTVANWANCTKPCGSCALHRSSRPDVFYKKGVLGNFAKFTGKHLCQSLYFNKVAGLRPVYTKLAHRETKVRSHTKKIGLFTSMQGL